jgi:hypothetical protein
MDLQTASSSPYYMGASGDRAFRLLNEGIQASLKNAQQQSKGVLFTVDTEGLWEEYLACFTDPVERQMHNCRCCQNFIRHYGGLVWISEGGVAHTAIWDETALGPHVPHRYWDVVRRLTRVVGQRKVEQLYLSSDVIWGRPQEGGFSHFWAQPAPNSFERRLTAGQAMAVRKEGHKHLGIALNDFNHQHLQQAVSMLQAGGLARPESILPMAEFLLDLQNKVHGKKGEHRSQIIWQAIGRSAVGWWTPRASALGVLIEEIAAGKNVREITRAHGERMDPLKYQRPQAAPAAGTVKQAELIFEKLGLGPALRRRPMALEEMDLFWRPRPPSPPPSGTGLFSHLQTKNGAPPPSKAELNSQSVTMTFAKFRRDVLPHALSIKLLTFGHGNYLGITTAVDPEAPPILQWDELVQRNPAAWYVYSGGSSALQWNLPSAQFVSVLGISLLPAEWYGKELYKHQSHGRVLFVLEGARDKYNKCLALFPECMRNDLHSVRSVIEAHSKSQALEDEPRQHAAGLVISEKMQFPVKLQVTTQNGVAHYAIDRTE